MSGPAQAGAAAAVAAVAVTSYKEILQAVLEKRPSGTRQRLATALGKNRSFVSQITNPAYGVPVPHRHLETIFDICRFSPEERRHFLAAYQLAHPHRLKLVGGGPRLRAHHRDAARPRRCRPQPRARRGAVGVRCRGWRRCWRKPEPHEAAELGGIA